MRKTLGKIGEYWRFLLIALIIDVVIFTSCSLIGVKDISYLYITVLCCLTHHRKQKSLIEHARERKSTAADMQRIIQSVVSAASDRDAKKVIQYVADYIGEEKNVNQKIEE